KFRKWKTERVRWQSRAPWKILWTCSKRCRGHDGHIPQFSAHPSRRYRRERDERHRGSAALERLRGVGIGFESDAGDFTAGETRRKNLRRASSGECAWRARGGDFFGRAAGQRGSDRSAPVEDSGDSAGRNAGGTDAAEVWN